MSEAPVTRATLLVRIRDSNDVEAWQQFLDVYGPFVYGWYRKRGLQDADASDLTQEVLQAVSSGADRLDYDPERGTFRSWLFTIARYKLHDFIQRRNRQPQGKGDAATLECIVSNRAADDEAQFEREYQERVFTLAADQVRMHVDQATWQAFWMTAVEGKAGQQAAEALGMSIGAVYVAKSRVLSRLKQKVEQIQGDE